MLKTKGDIQIIVHFCRPYMTKLSYPKSHGLYLIYDWAFSLGFIEMRRFVSQKDRNKRFEIYRAYNDKEDAENSIAEISKTEREASL